MRHDQAVFADIQTIWEARDKRRTHYVWAMPRDMWLLLRGCRDNNVEPLIRPGVESAAGVLFGQPIIIDNNTERLELRKAGEA